MRLIDADKLRHELIMGHDLVGAKYTDLAETEKAILVEWIEKYLKPFRETYEKIDDDWKPACRAGWVIYAIENMLRDWEKENADL